MNTRAVAEFFSKVQQNAELAKRVVAVKAGNKEAWASEITRIARQEGYIFEVSDIDAAVEEQKKFAAELDEGELDKVSGGTLLASFPKIEVSTFYQSWPSTWYAYKPQ